MNIACAVLPENRGGLLNAPALRALEGGRSRWAFAEACPDAILARWTEEKPDILVFPADSMGHELAVRLSARLGCPCFPEARNLRVTGSILTGRKKVCGSNLEWEFTAETPVILTVTPGTPEPAGLRLIEPPPPGWLLSREPLEPRRINPLENAALIFAAGRGLGSASACERLRRIAARFGAPLGFSRPAALNGWGNIGDIIGQSGIKTRAKVCVAFGISGSAAFMAGLEGVERLAAVNPDKNAPIFQYADLGITAPAEEYMSALETLVDKNQREEYDGIQTNIPGT